MPQKRFLGSHMSIAGGVDKAIERGALIDCTAIQIFVKNNNQWFGKPLPKDEIERFKKLQKETGIFVFAHAGYLINLASPKKDNYEKSIKSMLDEIERCEALSLPFIVIHPGSHTGEGEKFGIKKVTESLNLLIKKTKGYKVKIALETTAGQGSGLGYKFEHFEHWFTSVDNKERLGVCFDTCHSYTAGYDIKTESGYKETFSLFDKLIGIKNLLAFHLNDSKKELGSKKDRHEHIGEGTLGKEPFRLILNDKRFIDKPMVLETPKDPDMKLDVKNLSILKSLTPSIYTSSKPV
ncbi:deoxyribonuclease IV [candidate division WOR-1 bacterium RIFOXYD2_FULL_36_8]|uniref:Probable endonuclease 4 n=1 Tax=candidate division WOR-1 bacterium RIFOXYB2_FULL_36_35 TaxID=1802578 RepID=A0A1F4S8A8_UNCSA|nr:MAG: deoxyribonuclease IV [candidate division WOR-1 bacterium RIFOXYA2_FULL_36_21]OGC15343.1 MAG: deoxyribonuclease IV [candidate division WOR-1 bacterium RIFOXYA12_FULL_36_13]OGC16685.1 MAG: deoxyribonuclease IV [candidate division WOR-1 bacterium RIFOXYB2_FULL_36_35]OGC38530.1 MAG: deoxyribonuclease IV [candidate division WOR-1 bacterium RIFOXYD2_FULL_36_8]